MKEFEDQSLVQQRRGRQQRILEKAKHHEPTES